MCKGPLNTPVIRLTYFCVFLPRSVVSDVLQTSLSCFEASEDAGVSPVPT